MSTLFHVGKSPFGLGLFANVDIPKGTIVVRMEGRLIRMDEALSKGDRMMDPLQIGIGLYIDLEPDCVYVNHSCAPNLGLTTSFDLSALMDISAGDELFFDYSTTMLEKHETMKCACRSPECRGIVDDFDTLPNDLRRRYIDMGIVPVFILHAMAEGNG